jgi:beta-glucosidase
MAADIGERTLHDVYLWPWKAYAEAGGRGAMMAHNSVNQQPCHASADLMGWLRAQGNMSAGLLASDMCDVGLLGPRGFRVADGLQGAAALAMGAGLDQELCNPTDGRGQAFTLAGAAVAAGSLAQAALDRAAANALRGKFAAGLFDGRAWADGSNLALLNAPAHRALARRAAAEGAVLLKNDGMLPLRLPLKVAVIGPNAGCFDGAASCNATLSQTGGYTNNGAPVISFLAAGANESGVTLTSAPGCAHGGADTAGFPAALAAAAAADAVVFVGGDSGGLGWNRNTCGEDDDRAELELPGVQADLLDALLALGKPVALVLIHGRPVTLERFALLPRLSAVLAAWRPGCEGGGALWDLLTGRESPSGRLAQSWVRRVGQVKSQASPWFSALQGDFDRADYNGDAISLGATAQGAASWQPAFPFGFGLSYTRFEITPARVARVGEAIVATINVTNTGAAAGKQAVGVYYSRGLSAFARNHLYLFAFAKTAALAPGASQLLTVSAPVAALGSWEAARQAYVVEPGTYSFVVGPDSETVSGASFNVTI